MNCFTSHLIRLPSLFMQILADQVYALYQDYEFHNGTRLFFAIEQDATLEAQGQLLRILHLPHYVENNMVYQLFRPYGPLALCKLLLEPDDSSFHGSALVQYFYQEDTNAALNEMVKKRHHVVPVVTRFFIIGWSIYRWKHHVRRKRGEREREQ